MRESERVPQMPVLSCVLSPDRIALLISLVSFYANALPPLKNGRKDYAGAAREVLKPYRAAMSESEFQEAVADLTRELGRTGGRVADWQPRPFPPKPARPRRPRPTKFPGVVSVDAVRMIVEIAVSPVLSIAYQARAQGEIVWGSVSEVHRTFHDRARLEGHELLDERHPQAKRIALAVLRDRQQRQLRLL